MSLNIALIRSRYNPFGGAERFVSRAITALRGRGANLTLITRQWSTGGDFAPLICNPFYLGNVWRDWGFARAACRTLKQHRFDLVQSHERIACCDVYRAGDGVHREWLTQRRRTLNLAGKLRLLLNPYHHYILNAEARLFASPQLKAVICNSRMVRDEIRAYFGVAESKLHVIYSGVDTEAFHPRLKIHRSVIRERYGITQQTPLFLFVGSGFERKGLAAAISALENLPDAHLLVVGKDKKQAKFEKLARNKGLTARVHFAGGQQDTGAFYGAADAFVLPTLYDPFPNAALEAMASGLPVITSSKSGAAEFIESGRNGYVCDALDQPALVRAMRQLCTPSEAQTQGEAARQTVAAMNLDAMADQLYALYESLLQGLAAA